MRSIPSCSRMNSFATTSTSTSTSMATRAAASGLRTRLDGPAWSPSSSSPVLDTRFDPNVGGAVATNTTKAQVVIVGGGFAGLGCARRLVKDDDVRITLIDKNNYHQFQPLLYQVATAELGTGDVATSLRQVLRGHASVDVKMAEVMVVDPTTRTVTTRTGETYQGDVLVLAAGSCANFFDTQGAEKNSLPLYSLDEAQRLRSRVLTMFEDADRDPKIVDDGALNFIIIGGGATGTELAGALADMINLTMTREYTDLAVKRARVYVIEHGQSLLAPFPAEAHEYGARTLRQKGGQLP